MLFKSLQIISLSNASTSTKVSNGNQSSQFGNNQVSLLDAHIPLNINLAPLLVANADINAHL